jgi:pyruvate kinase
MMGPEITILDRFGRENYVSAVRKTKILATLGPASRAPAVLDQLIAAGLDAARLNFSHGAHEEHRAVYGALRDSAQRAGRPIAVLQDLQGPKIRLGKMATDTVTLAAGANFTITTRAILGTAERASTTYERLATDIKPGDRILLSDGAVGLSVESTDGETVLCRVIAGGTIRGKAGLNLPGVALSAPALTDKDLADLDFGVSLGVDAIAISFIRRATDLAAARTRLRAHGVPTPLIAKIERPEAIDDLDAILDAADGVMVARGDLAVEVSPERVPILQKEIIRAANARGKLVITATQMLESMTKSPRPTRAEASDVANAVLDGTDAVMLSGETAVGDYPVETVAMMSSICREVEESNIYRALPAPTLTRTPSSPELACAASAVVAARDLGLSTIACFTHSGATALLLSDLRPRARILALTPSRDTYHRLALTFGVTPVLVPLERDTDAMVALVERTVIATGAAKPGDTVIITMGVPVVTREKTNLVKVHQLPSS